MTQAHTDRPKILSIVTKSNFGGAQRYVYDLATGLPKDRFEPVVAFGPAAGGEEAGGLKSALADSGVRTVLIPELARDIGLSSDWQALHALIRLLKEERPAVVHLNSSKAGGLGAVAARFTGVPRIIFTVHGWPFWEKRNAVARYAIFFASYLTVLLSHETILISEHDRMAMSGMPFIARKLRVIHNGIAEEPVAPRDEARGALFSQADIASYRDCFWVASVSELTANKNCLAGIDAVAAYNAGASRRIFYCILGDGEERAAVESYIAARGLSDTVRVLGFVAGARRYLSAFDALLLPSRKEGVPYVVLEAGLAALPVVASRVGGIPEVIDNGKSGILCPEGDASAFAAGLGRLAAAGSSLGRELGLALQTRVRERFSLARMREETYVRY